MSNFPGVVYHCFAGKPQGGALMTMPAVPQTWLPSFNIYESTWGSNVAGSYVVDEVKLWTYLDSMQYPARVLQTGTESHSGGACLPTFTGPLCLDMEQFRPREAPAVFRRVLDIVRAWRPSAQLMLYGQINKWASQWDTPATAEAKMLETNDDNTTVITRHKHVPLYLKDNTAAATWERWNDKNAAECERWAAKSGGRGFAMVYPRQFDGATYVPITTAAQALAQVRPAVRLGLDIMVWDFWTTNAERDADVPALALIAAAIETAANDLWRE